MSAYGMHECCNLLSDGARKKKTCQLHTRLMKIASCTLDCGLWALDWRHLTLESGFYILNSGLWTLDSRFWTLHSGLWILDCGL